jgi:multidrug efflux pump
VEGITLYMQPVQDLTVEDRVSRTQYQFTLEDADAKELRSWTAKMLDKLKNVPELRDVATDQQNQAAQASLVIDRDTASRMGVTASAIDNTLYDAFGQRQVSTIYNDMNQYHVVMEVAPSFWQSPETLREVWVSTSGGALSGTQSTAAAVGDFSIGATATSTGTTASSTTGASVSPTPSPSISTLSSSTSSASGSVSATAASAGTAVTTTTSTSTASSNAAQNAQLNALANSARGGASTGASVSTSSETVVPLAAFAKYGPSTTPLAINHQGPFVASTLSYNLPEGVSLSQGIAAIERTTRELRVPISIHGSFAGTAQVYQQSLANEPWLIAAAIAAVYIVLGVLYESYVLPLTILSTLPSAGVGAVLALLVTGTEFSLIALIGVILLIGIVKKNAIMMIDVALTIERRDNVSARDAIYQACLLRFRPIMMTTFAALFGAIPLAVTHGSGAEMRQPLGISIVGGLVLSQILTLYTTPVVYLYLERFSRWLRRLRKPAADQMFGTGAQQPV